MKVELRGVSKRFGATLALDELTLDIGDGRIVALLGDNGAGKSTLLQMLASVLVPTRGTVDYDGERFGRERLDLRKRLFFIPDRPGVFPDHTAIQHIGMCLRLYEADRAGVADLVVSLLRDFDLLPLAEVPLRTLSRGQAYKAGLAGLIAVDPDLWLLDEPFASGMDPRGLAAFRRHVQKAAGRGRTIIYSTQIVELAESFADEVLVLDRGRLHFHDSVDHLREIHGSGERLLERLLAGPRK